MDVRRNLGFIASAGIGAGIMFLLDPQMGKRRLSLVRDQFVSAQTTAGRIIRGRTEDVKNRAYGLYCEVRGLLGNRCESDAGDTEGTTRKTTRGAAKKQPSRIRRVS